MGFIPLQVEVPLLLEHHVFFLDASCCRVLVSFSEVNDLCGDPGDGHGRRKLRSIKPMPWPSPPSRSTGRHPLPGVAVNLQHRPFSVCCSCLLAVFALKRI